MSSQRLCGVALSRVSRRLCVLGVARLATKKKRKKKSEKKKPRVHRTEARARVCVWTEEDTTEDDQHTRFQFCILTTRKLSSRLSFAFCVSRPTTEAKHHHHHHGWRRRAREAHEGTTTRPPFFFRRPVLVPIGFLFSSSLQNAKEEKPKRFFFQHETIDSKKKVNKKQELTLCCKHY